MTTEFSILKDSKVKKSFYVKNGKGVALRIFPLGNNEFDVFPKKELKNGKVKNFRSFFCDADYLFSNYPSFDLSFINE